MIVKNARKIAASSFSMWANYTGLLVLILPEVRYWATGMDTNPKAVWWIGVSLIVAGSIGRLIDQRMSDDA